MATPTRTFCRRTRREFLWEAGGGFTALPLLSLLSNDGFFSQAAQATELERAYTNPLAPQKPHHAALGNLR